MRGDVAAVNRLAKLRGEYEAVLAPQITRPVYLSPNWRSRWLLRTSRAVWESLTVRLLPLVLGAASTGPPFAVVRVRRRASEAS